ncbi:hypothetical protein EON65_45565 [archaeon]|nr:MAG: hypothetical protein EON65_45565 [archaeon]
MTSIFDDMFTGPGHGSGRIQPNKLENDLFIACSRNNLKKVDELLAQATQAQQHIDISYLVNGFSSLHTAAKKGYSDIVNRLVSYDEQCLQSRTLDGRNALMIAAYEGHLAVLVALANHKYMLVDSKDRNGNTALHYAAWGGHLGCVQHLVQHAEAQVTLKNNDQMLPLQYAAAGNHADIIEFLLQHSSEEAADGSVLGLNALHRAAQYGSLQILQLLLAAPKQPYDIAQCSANGCTALHYAAQHGHVEVVDLLLSHATSEVINKQNEFGLCSLHYACIG